MLGDLGTFLPHISGTVTVIGMGPTGVLTAFGLLYGFTGGFYGVPIAVVRRRTTYSRLAASRECPTRRGMGLPRVHSLCSRQAEWRYPPP